MRQAAPHGKTTSIHKKNHDFLLKTKKVRAKSSSEIFRDKNFRKFSRSKFFDFPIENCMKMKIFEIKKNQKFQKKK